MKLSVTTLSMLLSLTSFAQEMSSPDNQCRIQAKEIALKTYQSCMTNTRSAKIEQIRQEYSQKIADLKKQYEAQILELKTSTAEARKAVETSKKLEAAKATEVLTEPIELPTTNLDETPENVEANLNSQPEPQVQPKIAPKPQPTLKSEPVVTQDLQLEEPTITLRPANKPEAKPVVKPTSKVTPAKTSGNKTASVKTPVKISDKKVVNTKKVVPVVAQSRIKGQKAVKGVAKTLPVKQTPVEATPVADVAAEGALMKPVLAEEVKTPAKPQVSQATEVESTQQ